jgi:hypothetical protein
VIGASSRRRQIRSARGWAVHAPKSAADHHSVSSRDWRRRPPARLRRSCDADSPALAIKYALLRMEGAIPASKHERSTPESLESLFAVTA